MSHKYLLKHLDQRLNYGQQPRKPTDLFFCIWLELNTFVRADEFRHYLCVLVVTKVTVWSVTTLRHLW